MKILHKSPVSVYYPLLIMYTILYLYCQIVCQMQDAFAGNRETK